MVSSGARNHTSPFFAVEEKEVSPSVTPTRPVRARVGTPGGAGGIDGVGGIGGIGLMTKDHRVKQEKTKQVLAGHQPAKRQYTSLLRSDRLKLLQPNKMQAAKSPDGKF